MMDGVRIERAANGFTVTMTDPKIEAANRKRSTKSDYIAPYIDPRKEYVFTDFKAVMAFLTANLEKALPKEDFDSAFDLMADDKEDD